MLSTYVYDHPFNWDHHLCKVCMAYHGSVQSSTALLYYVWVPSTTPSGYHLQTYMHRFTNSITIHHQICTAAADLPAHSFQLSYRTCLIIYDKRHSIIRNSMAKPCKLGDLVWLYILLSPPKRLIKLYHPWTGPFNVQDIVSHLWNSTISVKRKQKMYLLIT